MDCPPIVHLHQYQCMHLAVVTAYIDQPTGLVEQQNMIVVETNAG